MTKKIASENIKIGVGIKTWLGLHTVVGIEPYTGPFDFVLNILVFSNGSKMSNEKGAMYDMWN